TDGDELLEPGARTVDHAERAVARAGELHGGLDDPAQERLERELRAQGDACLDETAEPARRRLPVRHGQLSLAVAGRTAPRGRERADARQPHGHEDGDMARAKTRRFPRLEPRGSLRRCRRDVLHGDADLGDELENAGSLDTPVHAHVTVTTGAKAA